MSGLDNVIAAETSLSEVDGANGRLVICGFELGDLAGRCPYEGVLALLLPDLLSSNAEAIRAELAQARMLAFQQLDQRDADLAGLGVTEGLRALMARLPDGEDRSAALLQIAAPAVFIPALVRARAGKKFASVVQTLRYAPEWRAARWCARAAMSRRRKGDPGRPSDWR